MDVDSELNTRVTALQGVRVAHSGVECLVVIHAPTHSQLGMRYMLDRPKLTIGRGVNNDIVLASDCISRHHVRIERRDKKLFSVDLDSTNGTFINDGMRPVSEHPLAPGDQLKIGDVIFKFLSGSDVESQYHEIIFGMTITDGLTNLANRKQLDALLAEEISRAQRHSRPLSVLMLDIDHFKRINDTYGHLVGDTVLRSLAALLQKRMRPSDKLGRYGGEEFCAILAETTLNNAAAIANELRELIAAYTFVADKHEINATISIGASTLQSGMKSDDLYKLADKMLYQAKRTGRNKVCC
jgi:two-component system, cell cycle response regulator